MRTADRMTREIAGFLLLCACTTTAVGQSLYDAARIGDLQQVQALDEQGLDLESRGRNDETPLLIAALEGHIDVVQWLIEHNAAIPARNKDGLTALHAAAYGGHKDISTLLIDEGADVNDANNRFRIVPLHPAAEENHIEIVELLISRGADLNVKEAHGYTPLSRATFKANWGVVKVLKRNGAECQSAAVVSAHFRQQCIEAR